MAGRTGTMFDRFGNPAGRRSAAGQDRHARRRRRTGWARAMPRRAATAHPSPSPSSPTRCPVRVRPRQTGRRSGSASPWPLTPMRRRQRAWPRDAAIRTVADVPARQRAVSRMQRRHCTSSSRDTGLWRGDCTRRNGEFGIVLIERGHEVGGGDTRFGVGTVRVSPRRPSFPTGAGYWSAVGIGRFASCVGCRTTPIRWRWSRTSRTTAGSRADGALGGARRAGGAHAASRIKAELDEPAVTSTVELESRSPRCSRFQLAAIAPIGPLDQQALLAEDDATAAPRAADRTVDDENRCSRARLAGG